MKVDSSNCFDVVDQLAPEASINLDWTEFDPINLPGLRSLSSRNLVEPPPQLIKNYSVGTRVRYLGGGKLNNELATIIDIRPYSTSNVSRFIILRFDGELPPHLTELPVTVPQNAHWLGEC